MEIILVVVSIVLILSVFLSLIRKDFWVFKILEYPRLQKLFILIIISLCWFIFWPLTNNFHLIVHGLLILSTGYLFYKILPYTVLSKKEMHRVNASDAGNDCKIFCANVLQENEAYERILEQIRFCDPDIIFLLETNRAWANATKALKNNYPYTLLAPLENTYGLLFYSRLKLDDAKVRFLVKPDVPSIEAIINLPSGKKLQAWGLHPEPPVPGESMYSTAKDKELMKVALQAKDCTLPYLIFGDFNDVAWSYTTELFRKTSKVLDPRRGRGFYNTFSAHHWYLRFPLDYIFCSREFGLITMTRLPKNGSDHFATITHLALEENLKQLQDPPEAREEDIEKAEELAAQPLKDE